MDERIVWLVTDAVCAASPPPPRAHPGPAQPPHAGAIPPRPLHPRPRLTIRPVLLTRARTWAAVAARPDIPPPLAPAVLCRPAAHREPDATRRFSGRRGPRLPSAVVPH